MERILEFLDLDGSVLEVAQRKSALLQKGGKSYSTLSLAGSLGFERKLAFEVPKMLLLLLQRVNSAVVHLWPRKSGWSQEQEQNFLEFVKAPLSATAKDVDEQSETAVSKMVSAGKREFGRAVF